MSPALVIPVDRPAAAASWCPTCREFTVIPANARCAWCNHQTVPLPDPAARKRTGTVSRLTDEHVRSLHRAHTRGHSLRALGRFLVDRGIYPTENSAVEGIRAGFRRLGLEARDRIDATVQASTRHGLAPRQGRGTAYNELRAQRARDRGDVRGVTCTATLIRPPHTGKPFANHALADSTLCRAHDPRYQDENHQALANARARRAA